MLETRSNFFWASFTKFPDFFLAGLKKKKFIIVPYTFFVLSSCISSETAKAKKFLKISRLSHKSGGANSPYSFRLDPKAGSQKIVKESGAR